MKKSSGARCQLVYKHILGVTHLLSLANALVILPFSFCDLFYVLMFVYNTTGSRVNPLIIYTFLTHLGQYLYLCIAFHFLTDSFIFIKFKWFIHRHVGMYIFILQGNKFLYLTMLVLSKKSKL